MNHSDKSSQLALPEELADTKDIFNHIFTLLTQIKEKKRKTLLDDFYNRVQEVSRLSNVERALKKREMLESTPETQEDSLFDEILTLATYNRDEIWANYYSSSKKIQKQGEKRAEICRQVHALLKSQPEESARKAIQTVAKRNKMALSTLERWWYGGKERLCLQDVYPDDYAAMLIPGYKGGTATAELSTEAWEWIKERLLQHPKISHTELYRQVKTEANQKGWVIPSQATVTRRVQENL